MNKPTELFNLLIIDVQEDFCNPTQGKLYVNGADNDCKRIADFINEYGDKIKSIILTLDWHPSDHCSFSTTWGEEDKIIATPINEWFEKHDINPVYGPGCIGDKIMTWPRHCVADDEGAKVQSDVWEACISFKEKYPHRSILIFRKGEEYEEYAAFKRPETSYSDDELGFLNDNTMLYITGEAADVCVKNTLYQLLHRYAPEGRKMIVLSDCMSAVDPNFSFEEDKIYCDFVEHGNSIENYTSTKE